MAHGRALDARTMSPPRTKLLRPIRLALLLENPMIWLCELCAGLLVAAALMARLCKLFAPTWAGAAASRPKRTTRRRTPAG
jgi:hypothetical protein